MRNISITDPSFLLACRTADVLPTDRQFRKFQNEHGEAYRAFQERESLREVDYECPVCGQTVCDYPPGSEITCPDDRVRLLPVVEFSETPRGQKARHDWARHYDELNGAPEGDDDR